MDEIFRQQVFEMIRLIPLGRVTSYGAVARAVGYPNHARHVGNALRHYDEDFPAHRVCNSSGQITAGCLAEFSDKLAAEGIEVVGNRIKDFRKVFWNPIEEL